MNNKYFAPVLEEKFLLNTDIMTASEDSDDNQSNEHDNSYIMSETILSFD